MPGRNPSQAREAFLAPLRRCLSCVTDAQFYVRTDGIGRTALTLSEFPLKLRSASLGGVELMLTHSFRTVAGESGDWHVSTTGYEYRLNDHAGQELVAWHWHPAPRPGPDFPHLHVASEPLTRHVHLSAGRVSIESVLRLLLADLRVKPRRDHAHDWAQVLDECEEDFIKHRRWHA